MGGRQDSWDSLVGGFLAWSPEELLCFTSLGSSIPTHRALGGDLDPVLTGSGASLRILLTLPPRGSLTSRSKMSSLTESGERGRIDHLNIRKRSKWGLHAVAVPRKHQALLTKSRHTTGVLKEKRSTIEMPQQAKGLFHVKSPEELPT